ncbi:MAG: hypothetical protein RIK87_12710 [Fuerstiella sp.]
MRFSVIGDFAEAVLLAEAIHASGDHRLVSCFVEGELAAALAKSKIPFPLVSSAEDAMLDPAVDVVVVAVRDVDESIGLVRRASQEERHVVAIPPDAVSTAYSFELHLLLDETRSGVLPLTGRWYTESSVEAALRALPAVRQLKLSLTLATDSAVQRRRQLHAIDAICSSGLVFSQITGLDVPGADGSLLTRTITLASGEASEIKTPPATVCFDQEPHSETTLDISGTDGGQSTIRTCIPDADSEAAAQNALPDLPRLVAALTDRDACQQQMEQFSNTLELLEGLDKSFRRRRTVDIYFDSVSERAVFKTQMTAIGCGVLTWMIFGMIGYLVMAQVLELPAIVLNIARGLWIAPLVIFLLAQLLLPLARERTPTHASTSDRQSD